MKVLDFGTVQGDTGGADTPAIKPILDGDAVNSTVSNRPTDNLRVRTDILKAEVHALRSRVAAEPVVLAVTTGGDAADLKWDGAYDPAVALAESPAVPDINDPAKAGAEKRGTGAFWLGADPAQSDVQLTIFSGRNSAESRNAFAKFDHNASFLLKTQDYPFTGNLIRARLSGQRTSGAKAYAVWSRPSVVIPRGEAAAGELPLTETDTLDIDVYADGSTTLADIQTALDSVSHPTLGTLVVHPLPGYNSSSTVNPGTNLPYTQFGGGVYPTEFVLPATALRNFFNTGLVDTYLTVSVSGTGAVTTLNVGDVSAISAGMEVTLVDTVSNNVETVEVVSVNVGGGSFTAAVNGVYTGVASTSSPTRVIAAPNRLRKGDTLIARLPSPAQWDQTQTLSEANLLLPRNKFYNGDEYRHDALTDVVIATVAPSADLMVYNKTALAKGVSLFAAESDNVRLGGDLAGPGSTAYTPKVVLAGTASPGIVQVNYANAGADATTTAAVDTDTGIVKGMGISSGVPGQQIKIGTSANDASVKIGTPTTATIVDGSLNVPNSSTILGGNLTVSGVATFQAPPSFTTNVPLANGATIGTSAELTAGNFSLSNATAQAIRKTGAGNLTVGTVGSGSVVLQTNNVTRWTITSTGSLQGSGTNTITQLPIAASGDEPVTKQYLNNVIGGYTNGGINQTIPVGSLFTFSAAKPPQFASKPLLSTMNSLALISKDHLVYDFVRQANTWDGAQTFNGTTSVPTAAVTVGANPSASSAVSIDYLRKHTRGSIVAAGYVTVSGGVGTATNSFGVESYSYVQGTATLTINLDSAYYVAGGTYLSFANLRETYYWEDNGTASHYLSWSMPVACPALSGSTATFQTQRLYKTHVGDHQDSAEIQPYVLAFSWYIMRVA